MASAASRVCARAPAPAREELGELLDVRRSPFFMWLCSRVRAASDQEAFEERERAALEIAIARHDRLMRVAERNGYAIDVRDVPGVGRLWYVPKDLVSIVGCMAARVSS